MMTGGVAVLRIVLLRLDFGLLVIWTSWLMQVCAICLILRSALSLWKAWRVYKELLNDV